MNRAEASPVGRSDFPGFSFRTHPKDCLMSDELAILEKRREHQNWLELFKRKETEYRLRGPRCVDTFGMLKMKSVKKLLISLHVGDSPNKDLNEAKPPSPLFSKFNLMNLIMAVGGNEDNIGHSQLVTRYALFLNNVLGIQDIPFGLAMEKGAALHDIGKIGIPESILRKAGKLTSAERKAVEAHPFLGYELIEGCDFLQNAVRVILFHHERFDGWGYPYGLRGDEIPLEARIFSVADTLDAILSDRPYRKGQELATAIREIEKGRGSQFDPHVVDAFLSVSPAYWERLREVALISSISKMIH
jgi:HD-GYP domain-containing protein (c-di-GMP phosphodiesterase class II)